MDGNGPTGNFTEVKLEKVDIMCMLVSDKNFDQVLLELKECLGTLEDKKFHMRSN